MIQGRYSFVGAQPSLEVVAKGFSVTTTRQQPGSAPPEVATREVEDPLLVPPLPLPCPASHSSTRHCAAARNHGQLDRAAYSAATMMRRPDCCRFALLQQWHLCRHLGVRACCSEVAAGLAAGERSFMIHLEICDGVMDEFAGASGPERKLAASPGPAAAACVHWRLGGLLRLRHCALRLYRCSPLLPPACELPTSLHHHARRVSGMQGVGPLWCGGGRV